MSVLLESRFLASAAELKLVRGGVREAVMRAGTPEAEAEDVVLAIDEACQNVIRHAYCDQQQGDIDLQIRLEGEVLVVDLRDFADPVDPDCVNRERDLEEVRPGGLGIHFMRSVMDEVAFVECSETRGNLLRMSKRIARSR